MFWIFCHCSNDHFYLVCFTWLAVFVYFSVGIKRFSVYLSYVICKNSILSEQTSELYLGTSVQLLCGIDLGWSNNITLLPPGVARVWPLHQLFWVFKIFWCCWFYSYCQLHTEWNKTLPLQIESSSSCLQHRPSSVLIVCSCEQLLLPGVTDNGTLRNQDGLVCTTRSFSPILWQATHLKKPAWDK